MSLEVHRSVIDDTLGNQRIVDDLQDKLFSGILQAFGYVMSAKELGLNQGVGRHDDAFDEPTIRELIPSVAWLNAEISEHWGSPPPDQRWFLGLKVRLRGLGYRTAWKDVIIRKTDVLRTYPSPKNKKSKGRQPDPFWEKIEKKIYNILIQDGIPAPYDGRQAELERFAASEAERMGENPSEDTVRRHVRKAINHRKAELPNTD